MGVGMGASRPVWFLVEGDGIHWVRTPSGDSGFSRKTWADVRGSHVGCVLSWDGKWGSPTGQCDL